MSVNPFDPRTVLLAKHAQHVVLIHFPIALFLVAVVFDVAAQYKKSRALAEAAFFNLLVAALSTVPVVATGLIAWQWALEGKKLRGILLMHLVLGLISAVLIWVAFWIHLRMRRQSNQYWPTYRFAVEAISGLVITATGHLGGFLSGVNSPV
ncbi:MAG TPA: DUF2231 domain-containing protein [Candidatus Acidoferrum sp.]